MEKVEVAIKTGDNTLAHGWCWWQRAKMARD